MHGEICWSLRILDAFQANQARTKREQAEETIGRRLPGTYP
jgi:hypothetical protein